MKRPKIHNKEDWQKGFDAGQKNASNLPPEGVEVLSWYSGYIEGKSHENEIYIDEVMRKEVL